MACFKKDTDAKTRHGVGGLAQAQVTSTWSCKGTGST